ncbi:hypothetical protein CX658_14760 [Pseudomonas amygdali pv. lachrymans]|nr:hypothetical protein CX658_14760 [Pseudomonas amygdali pv. lachrymans]
MTLINQGLQSVAGTKNRINQRLLSGERMTRASNNDLAVRIFFCLRLNVVQPYQVRTNRKVAETLQIGNLADVSFLTVLSSSAHLPVSYPDVSLFHP